MTYENPEQPPPLTPRRTAASGVPRCASFFFANSTALSEMVISRRDLGASDGEGVGAVVSADADEVSMKVLGFSFRGWRVQSRRQQACRRSRCRALGAQRAWLCSLRSRS